MKWPTPARAGAGAKAVPLEAALEVEARQSPAPRACASTFPDSIHRGSETALTGAGRLGQQGEKPGARVTAYARAGAAAISYSPSRAASMVTRASGERDAGAGPHAVPHAQGLLVDPYSAGGARPRAGGVLVIVRMLSRSASMRCSIAPVRSTVVLLEAFERARHRAGVRADRGARRRERVAWRRECRISRRCSAAQRLLGSRRSCPRVRCGSRGAWRRPRMRGRLSRRLQLALVGSALMQAQGPQALAARCSRGTSGG